MGSEGEKKNARISSRPLMRGAVIGSSRGEPAIQSVSDLTKSAQSGFNPTLAPAPPGGLGHPDLSKDRGHGEPRVFGALLDLNDFGGCCLHGRDTVQECTVCQCGNAQSLSGALVHNRAMPEIADEARSFLNRALAASGLKPHALAKKAGVAPTTITRPLNDPEFKFTPKPATLRKIAEAAGLDLPAGLAVGPAVAPTLQELPIIGPIQAGAWLALDETVQDEPIFFTAVADRRYPHARQWLREVRGDSMNAKGIVPGDLAHVVDVAEAGINLNSGMIVEVTRTRAGGSLREITLKEVEITSEGMRLWPRSTNPRWSEPLTLDDGQGGDIEVQVTGLLLQAIKRFL